MFKIFVLLISSLSAFGQVGFGSFNIVPTLGSGASGCSLLSIPGVVLYCDVSNSTVLAKSGSLTNSAVINGWSDLSSHNYSLTNPIVSITSPVWFTSGGPNGGAQIQFTNAANSYLTNAFLGGGQQYAQPLTVFLVMRVPSCCNADNVAFFFSSAVVTNVTSPPFQDEFNMYTLHPSAGISGMLIDTSNSASGAYLWDGTTGNGSGNFGFNYDSWQVMTLRFNGTNTQVFINGNGPKHTANYGPGYNPGTNGLAGFTLANLPRPTDTFVHTTAFSDPSQVSFVSLLIVQDIFPLNDANRLCIEEMLGRPYGISIP